MLGSSALEAAAALAAASDAERRLDLQPSWQGEAYSFYVNPCLNKGRVEHSFQLVITMNLLHNPDNSLAKQRQG